MENQKSEVLSFVAGERQKGRALEEILKNLKVSKSSYYRWLKSSSTAVEEATVVKSRTTVRSVTTEEKAKVDKLSSTTV